MPAATKNYRVTTAFTDPQGKAWKVGEDYKGQAAEKIQAALAARQIEELPAPAPEDK
jgi:hypothetical protein